MAETFSPLTLITEPGLDRDNQFLKSVTASGANHVRYPLTVTWFSCILSRNFQAAASEQFSSYVIIYMPSCWRGETVQFTLTVHTFYAASQYVDVDDRLRHYYLLLIFLYTGAASAFLLCFLPL